jgi:hypothetical protein
MAAASISMQAPSSADWGIISVALSPVSTTAAIAADASLLGGFGSSVSSRTVAMTLGASANYLLAFVIGDQTSDFVTGVTYNAVAMTQLVKLYPGSSVGWLYLYGLAAPTTGSSQNIVVSASASCSKLGVEAQSYTNCSASQPNVSTSASFKGQTIAWSVLVPVVPGCWGVSAMRYSVSGAPVFQSCTGCGTTASLRVSQQASDLGSIVDTNGTIPLLTAVALTANTLQWRLQRADIGRRSEEHLGS